MGHPKFKEILAEMQVEHDVKTQEYNGSNPPLDNWREALEIGVRPWRGAMTRITEKYSRMKVLASSPMADPKKIRDVLKEIAVYCVIDMILLDEDYEAKS